MNLEDFFDYDDDDEETEEKLEHEFNPALRTERRELPPRIESVEGHHIPKAMTEPKPPTEQELLAAELEKRSISELHELVRANDFQDEIFLGRGSVLAYDKQILAGMIAELMLEEDEDGLGTVEEGEEGDAGDGRALAGADKWPAGAPAPPTSDAQALDPDGPWGLAACGVTVETCTSEPIKGRGAFATRPFARGELVGIYWGEVLTRRQQLVRHFPEEAAAESPLTEAELEVERLRRERIEALPEERAPMGGVDNGGAYLFNVRPLDATAPDEARGASEPSDDAAPAYIDAEDGLRSTWCRYINHAEAGSAAINCTQQLDATGATPLLWLVTTRAIAIGEELHYCYSQLRRAPPPASLEGWLEAAQAMKELKLQQQTARWARLETSGGRPNDDKLAASGGGAEEEVAPEDFDASTQFEGAREWWLFKAWPLGLGYYRDAQRHEGD